MTVRHRRHSFTVSCYIRRHGRISHDPKLQLKHPNCTDDVFPLGLTLLSNNTTACLHKCWCNCCVIELVLPTVLPSFHPLVFSPPHYTLVSGLASDQCRSMRTQIFVARVPLLGPTCSHHVLRSCLCWQDVFHSQFIYLLRVCFHNITKWLSPWSQYAWSPSGVGQEFPWVFSS